jgi:hypothetical protein
MNSSSITHAVVPPSPPSSMHTSPLHPPRTHAGRAEPEPGATSLVRLPLSQAPASSSASSRIVRIIVAEDHHRHRARADSRGTSSARESASSRTNHLLDARSSRFGSRHTLVSSRRSSRPLCRARCKPCRCSLTSRNHCRLPQILGSQQVACCRFVVWIHHTRTRVLREVRSACGDSSVTVAMYNCSNARNAAGR